jgi:hypothetical protein
MEHDGRSRQFLVSRFLCVVMVAIALAWSASSLSAQSINVDFGAGSVPSDGYAAVGVAGRWNSIGVLPPYTRAPLVDVTGIPVAARIYMVGATQVLTFDNPSTAGDDAALMDDMLIGMNDPTDECLWIERLVDDDYEVTLYAMTPDDATRMSRVRVDDGTPGPVEVGGAWPGVHRKGVTFERFVVHPAGGLIAFHSGLAGAYVQSGMNGVQIRPLSTTSAPSPARGALRLRISPNPSRASEAVEFELPSALSRGRLELFDLRGRLVWTQILEPGRPGRWDGRDLGGQRAPSGVLFARVSDLATGSSRITARVVRLR